MMKAGVLAIGLCAASVPAQAQMAWTDKGFLAVDVGGQFGAKTFDTSSTFPLYEEDATLQTTQKGKSSPVLDIRGAYKVWGNNLLVGAGISFASFKSDVAINASIPDPAEFDQLRQVSLTASDAKHSETQFHISATWMMPVTDKIDLGFSAGPTIFLLSKDVVSALSVTEPGPSADAVITDESETSVGFHLGLDVQYMLNKRYGVGGLARYTWGSATVSSGDVTTGGFQIGGGLRVRF
jgi:hypothetical protein